MNEHEAKSTGVETPDPVLEYKELVRMEALKNNCDERGNRRFSDEQISAWMNLGGPPVKVTEESMLEDYLTQSQKTQEIREKLEQAGIPLPVPASSQTYVSTTPEQKISLKRWRNAEQRVCELLRKLGWDVKDVSQQKMGYDIVGRDPEGKDTFIDVKSIEKEGEPFTLTPHEISVAGQKGVSYQVAVVRQAILELEIALIADPAHRLKLTQKCRQWEWECVEYEFNPRRYPLD